MRNYGCERCALRHGNRLKCLGQRADLVHLDEDRIGCTFGDTAGKAFRIGDEQIIAHELALIANCRSQRFPSLPVLLGQTVFDGNDGVFRHQIRIEVGHAARIQRLAFA